MSSRMNRREFGRLTTAGIVGAMPLAHCLNGAAAAAGEQRPAVFPFGAHVYREPHLPLEQLRADFPLLKRLGLNMVKIQESWSHDERKEGEIDLSNVAQVVSDAAQNGLMVYFGVTMEQAPGWLWKKFPDAGMVYETGQPDNDPTQYLLPSDGKPGPCWHHEGARQAAARFLRTLGREIGKHENIRVWNVMQEIGFYPWAMREGHLGFCYCEHTLAAFRAWLRRRYASIERLNDAWKTGYGDWDEIQPPRHFVKVPAMIDWRRFMEVEYLAFSLRWKAEALRASDPQRRPVMAHRAAPRMGGTADWRLAKELDVFGSSCYPEWGGPFWESTLLAFDHLRSSCAGRDFWAAELQGGPIAETLKLRHVPEPADIRRWVLGCLSTGITGISFWNHRAEIFWGEGYGFGLLDAKGTSTPRAEEAGRLSKAINAHADVFTRGTPPEPEVGLVVGEDLLTFIEASGKETAAAWSHSLRGTYQGLWETGFVSGFVDAEQAASSRCKVLVFPFPVALSPEAVEQLRAYVAAGGVLVSEACPGRFSQFGLGFAEEMAPGLAELFGAEHKRVAMIAEPAGHATAEHREATNADQIDYRLLSGAGALAGQSIVPAYYLQTLAPTTASVVLKYGDRAAGTLNRFGRGRAYLVGTLLGHGLRLYGDRRNVAALTAILGAAGVKPDCIGPLLRRRRMVGDRAAWFLFNNGNEPTRQRVPLERYTSAADLLGGPLKVVDGHVEIEVGPNEIRCLVLE